MWQKFATLLRAQLTLYDKLLALSQEQTRLLREGYREPSDALVKEEEALLAQLAQLDEKTAAQKAALPGCAPDEALLACAARAPAPQSEALRRLILRLDAAARELKEQNRQNVALLERAMRFAQINFSALTQTTADDFYTPKQDGAVVSKKKLFDETVRYRCRRFFDEKSVKTHDEIDLRGPQYDGARHVYASDFPRHGGT